MNIYAAPQLPFTQRWFAPVLEGGSTFCAPNLSTTIQFIGNRVFELPISINAAEWENCWLCSPWTHYISYGMEEVKRATSGVTSSVLRSILMTLGSTLKLVQFNKVVVVNNWLLSTTPWPRETAQHLTDLLECLLTAYPEHTIIMRSLNAKESPEILHALARHQLRLIPSRRVWCYSKAPTSSRDFKKDVKLLQQGDLEVVPSNSLQAGDFPALTALYEQLYIQKYSRHNPQYSTAWLQHLWKEKLLEFTALRAPDGRFMGIEACGPLHGILTSPIIGYDLQAPAKLGLYRRLAAIPLLRGQQQRISVNLSAGVDQFKALRGGECVQEYLAVFDRHLPASRRWPWALIGRLSEALFSRLDSMNPRTW